MSSQRSKPLRRGLALHSASSTNVLRLRTKGANAEHVRRTFASPLPRTRPDCSATSHDTRRSATRHDPVLLPVLDRERAQSPASRLPQSRHPRTLPQRTLLHNTRVLGPRLQLPLDAQLASQRHESWTLADRCRRLPRIAADAHRRPAAMDFNSSSPFPEGVISFLDTDLYKLTMQCAVFKFFKNIEVTYAFTNRTPDKRLSRAGFKWLDEQIRSECLESISLFSLLTPRARARQYFAAQRRVPIPQDALPLPHARLPRVSEGVSTETARPGRRHVCPSRRGHWGRL